MISTFAATAMRLLGILFFLYSFLCSLDLMGTAFKIVAGRQAGGMFGAITNPISGLTVGIIGTVLLQSSSTTTSIIVSMVGSGIMTVQTGIPVIMGANIGTSVTNSLVSLTYAADREQFRRAFSGASIHDLFNILSVAVFLPLEVITNSINGGNGGLLFLSSEAMTSGLQGLQKKGTKWKGPLKRIVSPLVTALVKIDKGVISDYSIGYPTAQLCQSFLCPEQDCYYEFYTGTSEDSCLGIPCADRGSCQSDEVKINYCGNSTVDEVCLKAAQQYFNDLEIVVGGAIHDSGLTDNSTGWLLLALSVTLLCLCLLGLVKTLTSLLSSMSENCVRRAFHINPYLAILVGTGVTVLVQSSSVTTSALVPLVGVGVLPLENMFPLTLGANIGTTATGLLASMVSTKRAALQIALVHLIFNILGILVWFPLPFMRRVPLAGAVWLGTKAERYRWLPFMYNLVTFILVPLTALGLSLLFEMETPEIVVASILSFLLIGTGLWGYWQVKYREGEKRLDQCMTKIYEKHWKKSPVVVEVPEV